MKNLLIIPFSISVNGFTFTSDLSNVFTAALPADSTNIHETTKPVHRCLQELTIGSKPCDRRSRTRFYFDSDSDQCKEFTWTGCDEGGNSFIKKKGCDRTCGRFKNQDNKIENRKAGSSKFEPVEGPGDFMLGPGLVNDKLMQPGAGRIPGKKFEPKENDDGVMVGPGFGRLPGGVIFKPNTGPGGPGGLGDGPGFSSPGDLVEKRKVGAPEDICAQPIQGGPCRALNSAWAFNSKTGKCEGFTYGGCRGNLNRFNSKENCEEFCGHLQGDGIDVIDDGFSSPGDFSRPGPGQPGYDAAFGMPYPGMNNVVKPIAPKKSDSDSDIVNVHDIFGRRGKFF